MSEAVEPITSLSTRIELARKLYREYYAFCFWHMKPDLVITEELVPLVIKGLRAHGGRRGLFAAAELEK